MIKLILIFILFIFIARFLKSLYLNNNQKNNKNIIDAEFEEIE